jgi:predicted DNA binding CopG/RHH family protein
MPKISEEKRITLRDAAKIALDPPAHVDIRAIAKSQGIPYSKLIVRAIDEYLANHQIPVIRPQR